jgi:hypothetical protein
MGTQFADVEPLLVEYLFDALAASEDPVAASVLVSVKKPDAAESPYPSKIVTVRSDGGMDTQRNLIRSERIGVNVWADTYADASNLASLVDAILRDCKTGAIKLVETQMSPVRVPNEGKQEQRYMTYQLVVKAADL